MCTCILYVTTNTEKRNTNLTYKYIFGVNSVFFKSQFFKKFEGLFIRTDETDSN